MKENFVICCFYKITCPPIRAVDGTGPKLERGLT